MTNLHWAEGFKVKTGPALSHPTVVQLLLQNLFQSAENKTLDTLSRVSRVTLNACSTLEMFLEWKWFNLKLFQQKRKKGQQLQSKNCQHQPWNLLIDQKSRSWTIRNSTLWPPLPPLLSVCFSFVMPSPRPENFFLLTQPLPPWLLWSVCRKAWH